MPHIHDLIDFCAEVFIVHKNTILLRMHDKYHIWLSVGGHIELDEDPVEAAIREVKEEVGLDIELDDRRNDPMADDHTRDLNPPHFLNRNRISPTHEHVTFVYFARAKNNKIIQPENEERSSHCKWFTKEEIERSSEIVPNVKYYALKALERLSTQ